MKPIIGTDENNSIVMQSHPLSPLTVIVDFLDDSVHFRIEYLDEDGDDIMVVDEYHDHNYMAHLAKMKQIYAGREESY